MAEERPNPYGIVINGNEATWEANLDGPIAGSYKGKFVFRCYLNPMQKINADKDNRMLLGVNPTLADAHVTNLAWSLSQLKQRIIKAPPYWDAEENVYPGAAVADSEVVETIMTVAIEAELLFGETIQKRKQDALERSKRAVEAMLKQQDDTAVADPEEDDDELEG